MDTGASSSIGTPFTDAPNGFIQIGMMIGAQYSAVLQNNTVYWIANDLTIRYLNGTSPVRASNHGIEFDPIDLEFHRLLRLRVLTLRWASFSAWTFPASSRTLVP